MAAKEKKIEVRKIKAGEKISEPGVYDMPIEWYHDDCCVGPSISSTGLRTLIADCPAKYWAHSYLNPNRIPEEEKDHFTFGAAAHTLLLGETGFMQRYAVRPKEIADEEGKMKPWQGNRNVCKMWIAEQEALGRRVLTPDEIDLIRMMAKSLENDPIMQQGILTGEVERSLIWQDGETGIWVKTRPDALPAKGEFIGDIKTIANSDGYSCVQAIKNHRYYQSMALAGEGVFQIYGRRLPDDAYILIFVGKEKPCLTNVKPLDPQWIAYGRSLNRKALRLFAECWDEGEWPTYADSGQSVHVPDYMRKEVEAEIKHGGRG